METTNTASLAAWWQRLGASDAVMMRVFRTFNAAAPPFRRESEAHEETKTNHHG
jgi:hypothetical protein